MLRRVIMWVGLLVVGLSSTASAQDVMRWESDIATAQRTAAQTNRLVLVHFGATWCGPCKEMENTVFNQPGLGTALNPYYVGVKIDVDAQPALAKQLQVGPIPCDIVMTPEGKIVARNEGKKPAGEYVAMLNRAAQQARAIQGTPPAAAAPVASAAAAATSAPQSAPYSPYAVPGQPPAVSPYVPAPIAAPAPTDAPINVRATNTQPASTASASLVGSRYSTVYTPPAGTPTTPATVATPGVPAPAYAPPQVAVTAPVATPSPIPSSNTTAATSGLGPRYSATSVGDRYATLPTSTPAVAPTVNNIAPPTTAPPVAPTTVAAPTIAPTTVAITTPTPTPTPTPVTTSVPSTGSSTTTAPAGGSSTSTVGSRYAATSVGDRYATMPSNTSPISTPLSTPIPTPVPSPVVATTAPPVAKPAITPPAIATTTPPSGAMIAPTGIASPSPSPANVAAAAPAKPQPMEHSKPLGGPVAPKVDATSQTLAELQAQLPPGSPPLALDGYCPVTVTEKMVWKRGDAAFGALHRGMTYLFVSAAEQQKFLAKPDAYSPIISGHDPVAVVEEAKLVPGKRDIGMKCGDQMILFSSKENYEKFRRDQQRYMIGLQQAMQAGGTMRR
jgi:thiol-disulfide isomerase/thioredoxin/YHS domain-containing protein